MVIPLYSWNTGGSAETDYAQVVSHLVEGLPRNAILCVQEAARGKTGWQQISKGSWTTVLHRHTAAWRGSGIVFHEATWRVMRKKATERGTWFRVRHVDGIECWVGTHAAEVSDHVQSLPATTLPVLLGCDVNSEVTWGLDDQGDPVVGKPWSSSQPARFVGSALRYRPRRISGPRRVDLDSKGSRANRLTPSWQLG